jgi:hypothetical protein
MYVSLKMKSCVWVNFILTSHWCLGYLWVCFVNVLTALRACMYVFQWAHITQSKSSSLPTKMYCGHSGCLWLTNLVIMLKVVDVDS